MDLCFIWGVTSRVPTFRSCDHYHWGVKHGCPPSPTLFGLYIDEVLDYIDRWGRARAGLARVSIPILLYADDIVLITDSLRDCSATWKPYRHFVRIESCPGVFSIKRSDFRGEVRAIILSGCEGRPPFKTSYLHGKRSHIYYSKLAGESHRVVIWNRCMCICIQAIPL